MKKLLTILLCCSSVFLIAQKKAVTETGEEVILYTDGTWKYTKAQDTNKTIRTNLVNFKKPGTGSFLLKSKKLNVGFWFESKKWSYKKGTNNPDAEYELQLIDGDL